MRGSHENGDIFFQHREACNKYYDALPAIVEEVYGQGQRQARHRLSSSSTTTALLTRTV